MPRAKKMIQAADDSQTPDSSIPSSTPTESPTPSKPSPLPAGFDPLQAAKTLIQQGRLLNVYQKMQREQGVEIPTFVNYAVNFVDSPTEASKIKVVLNLQLQPYAELLDHVEDGVILPGLNDGGTPE